MGAVAAGQFTTTATCSAAFPGRGFLRQMQSHPELGSQTRGHQRPDHIGERNANNKPDQQ
jgi:hypothetical protein